MKEKPLAKEVTEEVGKKRRGWNWGMILVGVVVLLIVASLSAPMVIRCPRATERTRAISNAKQLGLALLEFDQEFGSFPDESTAPLVHEASELNPKLDLSGTSANAMFRQLIAFGIQSEDIFYCQHPEGVRKPDRDLSPGKALEAGEVGFSYIMVEGEAQNTSSNPRRAVLAAPMKIGSDQFWPEPFGEKGVLLRLDNSVDIPLIRKSDGRLSVGNGKTLFDTGPETPWDHDKPSVIHPEPGR